MKSKKSVSMKAVVVLMALVLLIGCGVGGTLAWLMDTTDNVTNTFSVGNIDIDIYEHTLETDGDLSTTETKSRADYKILPGTSEKKDPTVEILKNSENCFVFMQVQEISNTIPGSDPAKKYITYTIDSAVWTQLMDSSGNPVAVNGVPVYYATTNYTTQSTDKTYNILTDKKVSYSNDLTKDDINKLYTYGTDGNVENVTKPQLIFKAFAVQSEGLTKDNGAGTATSITTAIDAWDFIDEKEKLGYAAPTNP